MKIVIIICRILLGLMFLAAGIMSLVPHPVKLPPMDPVHAALVSACMTSVLTTGWGKVIGVCMALGGLFVLLGRTTPLGLCFLGPVLVNILCYHVFLMGGQGIIPGLVACLLWFVLLYAYRANFAGIFSTQATPTLT